MIDNRDSKIISLLEEYGYISVRDLANLLHVSTPTLRRNLSELEREGIVVRNHGGVILASNGLPKPFSYRYGNMREEKQHIANVASSLVSDGSIIYIDTSTTVLCMIEYLRGKKNLTVVTNSLPAVTLLNTYSIPVKCTGGDLNVESMGFVGHSAELYLASLYTDYAFLSTPAINAKGRISDYTEQETYLRKVAITHTSNSVLLFEKGKFGKDAPFTLCDANEIDYLISNQDIPKTESYHFREKSRKGDVSIMINEQK